MNQTRLFFQKYQLVIYFLLAYALSWWTFPLMGGAIFPQGPALAAVIVLAVVAGRSGLAGLWRQIAKWRVRWFWYLLAPGIILGIHLAAFTTMQLLGKPASSYAHLQPWTLILPVIFQLVFFGGQWEEPGWSGYALPNLQDRFSNRGPNGILLASLVLAAFRAIWHLPLGLSGSIPWFDIVFYSLALQLIITWVYNRTRGSVLIVMLLHFSSNVFPQVFLPMFSGQDKDLYWLLFILAACVVAAGLVILSGRKLGMQPVDENS